MAQNQIETWLNQELMTPVKVRYLDGNLFSMDNAGNLIGVTLTKGGTDYSGGGTVSANVIRSDGGTVAVSGALSGNVATVVLPQAAYAIPGVVSIVMKLTVSGEVTTIAAVVANVYESTTSTTVDPGTIIPSVSALISQIDTAVASIPADYSSLWTSLAPAFSTSNAYAVGDYVTYDGGLYRFTSAHAPGSWSASDVSAAVIGNDLRGLKSAVNDLESDKISIEKTIFDYTSTTIDYTSKTQIRVQSGILLDNGNSNTVGYSVRSKHTSMYKANFGDYLKCTDSDYHIRVGYYTTNSTGSTYLAYITPFTDEVYLDPRYYFAICIALVDTTATIDTDEALASVTQYFATAKTTNIQTELSAFENIAVQTIPAKTVDVDSVSMTAVSAGTYKSKDVFYTLDELHLKVGDHVYLFIGSQEGCADENIFSLEAYNDNTRLNQFFVTKTAMKTDMVIPINTTRICFTYRMNLATPVAQGATATWSNIKLYNNVVSDDIKIIPSNYIINPISDEINFLDITSGTRAYFEEEVKTTIETIEAHSDTPSFVMAIVADPHLLISNSERIRRTKDTFKNINAVYRYCHADGIAIVGDLVQGNITGMTQAEVDETIRDVIGWARYCNDHVYAVNGNHDGTNGSIPKTDNYCTMLRFNENYVVRENGAPYFYVDYPAHKLRAIFVCTNQQPAGAQPSAHIWGMGNDQLTWFTATLASVPTGYDIVIFSHIGTFDTEDFRTNRSECCSALNNWISNHSTQKCIGWYCGHEHLDCIVPTSASGINCPQVVLQCSLMSGWSPTASYTFIYSLPWVNNSRTDNTVTQDCWTTLVYNKKDQKVYLVRFGAGNDMTIDLSDY